MTKRDIVIFIFKWEKSLFGYWFLIIGLSVLLVYSLPQKYIAVAKILIEGNRAPVMRADIAFGVEQMNVINSGVAIVRSTPVLSATADRVEMLRKAKKKEGVEQDQPSLVGRFFQSIRQWLLDVGLQDSLSPRDQLIRDLSYGLKVEPQANSSVISISYKSDDPEMAAAIVNSITENYIKHHLQVYGSIGTSEVYRLQIARLEKDLEGRKQELSEYKQQKSVSALSETRRALVQRQAQLTAELNRIETSLTELKTRFGKGHTRIVLAEERLRSTQASLEETTAELQDLELREADIRDMEIEINSMELMVQSYRKLFQEEQVVNLANPEVVNVRVIEKAEVPGVPTHSRLFFVVLATIGGLLISFAIAFIKEYFDHRITDPKLAAQLLGVPTLGSIEKI